MILSSGIKVETIVTEHLKLEDGNSTYFDNPVIALRMNNEILPFGRVLLSMQLQLNR